MHTIAPITSRQYARYTGLVTCTDRSTNSLTNTQNRRCILRRGLGFGFVLFAFESSWVALG